MLGGVLTHDHWNYIGTGRFPSASNRSTDAKSSQDSTPGETLEPQRDRLMMSSLFDLKVEADRSRKYIFERCHDAAAALASKLVCGTCNADISSSDGAPSAPVVCLWIVKRMNVA